MVTPRQANHSDSVSLGPSQDHSLVSRNVEHSRKFFEISNSNVVSTATDSKNQYVKESRPSSSPSQVVSSKTLKSKVHEVTSHSPSNQKMYTIPVVELSFNKKKQSFKQSESTITVDSLDWLDSLSKSKMEEGDESYGSKEEIESQVVKEQKEEALLEDMTQQEEDMETKPDPDDTIVTSKRAIADTSVVSQSPLFPEDANGVIDPIISVKRKPTPKLKQPSRKKSLWKNRKDDMNERNRIMEIRKRSPMKQSSVNTETLLRDASKKKVMVFICRSSRCSFRYHNNG